MAPGWNVGEGRLLKVLLIFRLLAAAFTSISDCDETFNYWEPTHYLLHGHGMQTWEYSPAYMLRTYAYVGLHALVGAVAKYFELSKTMQFFAIRCVLAIACALCEFSFCRAIGKRLGGRVEVLAGITLLFSPGLTFSSAAMLPSSFAMYACFAFMAFWMTGRRPAALYAVAVAVLLAWPFAGALGIPFAIEALWRRREILKLLLHGIAAVALLLPPMILVDKYYYGRWVVPSLQIVLYNVLGGEGRGPELYGVEPVSYYLVNGFLNFTLAFPLALIVAPTILLATALRRFRPQFWPYGGMEPGELLVKVSVMYVWFAIFFAQPHKEERFLSPAYPLIALGAAVVIDLSVNMLLTALRKTSPKASLRGTLLAFPMLVIVLLGGSRIIALNSNYAAPQVLYGMLSHVEHVPSADNVTLCVGSEWYRFMTHFYLPDHVRLNFVRSRVGGLLPKYFGSPAPNGTREIPDGMNDLNQEVLSRYVPLETCDYLIELCDDDSSLCSRAEKELGFQQGYCVPFLDKNRSPAIPRAFYIPYISTQRNTFAPYCLFIADSSL